MNRFKNTFFGDILEAVNLVQYIETLPVGTNKISNIQIKGMLTNFDDLENQKSFVLERTSMRDSNDNCSGQELESTKSNNLSQLNFTKVFNEGVKTEEDEFDNFLVDWNGADDPEYPLNWSIVEKTALISQIMLLTCITYMGSSIYTPGQEDIQKEFHVGHVTATLNMSLYVLGYGIGPVMFSPLSEVAKFGRMQLYMYTLLLFTLFQIGCATVHNIGGLITMRFIAGILCSPSLATGGASIADVMKPENLTPFIALWAVGAVAAPVLAPLLGACMVVAKNWRWIFWFLAIVCGACVILFTFFLKETSHSNILSRRAKRLRYQTVDTRYYTSQEVLDSKMEPKDFMIKTFYRPIKMIIQEPIILAFDFYISLVYGAFYLFFEAFPLVFIGIYNFTLIELGLSYFGFCIGCVFAYCVLLVFIQKVIKPSFANNTFTPEIFLRLAMPTAWLLPAALFLFGWAASTHWIVPIISEVIFILSTFNLFQTTYAYLSSSYPKYIASVFAGNGLCRAVFACAFPLFGQAMYNALAVDGYPVAWGSSLIGFTTIGLATIPFVLNKYGPALRSKSSFID